MKLGISLDWGLCILVLTWTISLRRMWKPNSRMAKMMTSHLTRIEAQNIKTLIPCPKTTGKARGATQGTLSRNHQMLLKENRPRVNIAASGDRRRQQREA